MDPVILPLCTFAGTLTVLAIGFIYNNSRISDLRSDMDHRFQDLRDLIETKLALQETKLAMQQEILLSKFAELDNRLTRIESHLNLH
ncbi:MAG: hypothetical protein JO211_00660 [Acidobacteriaceae bacterium]|nr:hypothetical protein [Acidobacteriaceae bacterium]